MQHSGVLRSDKVFILARLLSSLGITYILYRFGLLVIQLIEAQKPNKNNYATEQPKTWCQRLLLI